MKQNFTSIKEFIYNAKNVDGKIISCLQEIGNTLYGIHCNRYAIKEYPIDNLEVVLFDDGVVTLLLDCGRYHFDVWVKPTKSSKAQLCVLTFVGEPIIVDYFGTTYDDAIEIAKHNTMLKYKDRIH